MLLPLTIESLPGSSNRHDLLKTEVSARRMMLFADDKGPHSAHRDMRSACGNRTGAGVFFGPYVIADPRICTVIELKPPV
jgi:hypothetical protein